MTLLKSWMIYNRRVELPQNNFCSKIRLTWEVGAVECPSFCVCAIGALITWVWVLGAAMSVPKPSISMIALNVGDFCGLNSGSWSGTIWTGPVASCGGGIFCACGIGLGCWRAAAGLAWGCPCPLKLSYNKIIRLKFVCGVNFFIRAKKCCVHLHIVTSLNVYGFCNILLRI